MANNYEEMNNVSLLRELDKFVSIRENSLNNTFVYQNAEEEIEIINRYILERMGD